MTASATNQTKLINRSNSGIERSKQSLYDWCSALPGHDLVLLQQHILALMKPTDDLYESTLPPSFSRKRAHQLHWRPSSPRQLLLLISTFNCCHCNLFSPFPDHMLAHSGEAVAHANTPGTHTSQFRPQ